MTDVRTARAAIVSAEPTEGDRRAALARLHRGGFAPSRRDRWYFTERVEFFDRLDVPATTRARVLIGLDRFNRVTLSYRQQVRWIYAAAGDVAVPRILELGSGHGELSRALLAHHPRARVTASDIDPAIVSALRNSAVGQEPRADVRTLDATAIDAPADTWDVAVLVFAFHHLEPLEASAIIREGTRVAQTLIIVDGWRNPCLLALTPALFLLGGWYLFHDGVISLRRMYSAAAMRALGEHCGAPVDVRSRVEPPGFLVTEVSRRAS